DPSSTTQAICTRRGVHSKETRDTRLRQVPRSEIHERGRPIYAMLLADRCPVADPGTATGSPGNWWTVFAGVPDCFDHAVQGFAFYRSPKRKMRVAGRPY